MILLLNSKDVGWIFPAHFIWNTDELQTSSTRPGKHTHTHFASIPVHLRNRRFLLNLFCRFGFARQGTGRRKAVRGSVLGSRRDLEFGVLCWTIYTIGR